MTIKAFLLPPMALLFYYYDRHRARVGSLHHAVGKVVGHLSLCRVVVDPVLLNDRTQAVVWVLFKDVRAERPAGLATDAARPVDGNFHHSHTSVLRREGPSCMLKVTEADGPQGSPGERPTVRHSVPGHRQGISPARPDL